MSNEQSKAQIRSFFRFPDGIAEKGDYTMADVNLLEFICRYVAKVRKFLKELEKEKNLYFDFYIKFHIDSGPLIDRKLVLVIKRSANDDSAGESIDGQNPVVIERDDLSIPFMDKGCMSVSSVEAMFDLLRGECNSVRDIAFEAVFRPLVETMMESVDNPGLRTREAFILCQWEGFYLSDLIDEYCGKYGIREFSNFIDTFDNLVTDGRITIGPDADVAAFFIR